MNNMVEVAVIPAAGWGTRFLPATKAIPKEMVPIGDKPVVQYAVEEAARAGIKHIVLISHGAKQALENHFDRNAELEQVLSSRNKTDFLLKVRGTLPDGVRISVVRQGEALGLGHAVLCAEACVGNRPFAVMLPDDLLLGKGQTMTEMVALHDKHKAYSIAVEEVPLEATKSYGIVSVQDMAAGTRITGMIEKPAPEAAPSRLAVVGRYVLPGEIFSVLRELAPGAGGEIQLTDGIAALLGRHTFLAHRFADLRFDCGSKWGFLTANIHLALRDPETRERLQEWLTVEANRQ